MRVEAFENLDDDPRRRHAPATVRNRNVIGALLADVLSMLPPNKSRRLLLEIASGTGEHAAHLAGPLGSTLEGPFAWQPTDIDPHHLESITAWREVSHPDHIRPPIKLDVGSHGWHADLDQPDVIFSANLVHIAPIIVGETMIAGAGQLLDAGGLLLMYGPFKVGGAHTSDSNQDFEEWLKNKDAAFGVRDQEWAVEQAGKAGLTLREARSMPANNFTLIFEKKG